jgi:hypothetical protein
VRRPDAKLYTESGEFCTPTHTSGKAFPQPPGKPVNRSSAHTSALLDSRVQTGPGGEDSLWKA